MGYACDRCNLEFPDFEQYLDHECKSYKQLPTQLTKNEPWTLENLFHMCKTANKSHIGNISVNKENNTFLRTDTSLEFRSLDFDSSANELRYQTFIERTTPQPVFDDFESYLQTQYAAYEPNAEVNFNQPSTSFGQRQISEKNAQINTNPLLASINLSPNQLFNRAMNQFDNINQETVSAEYSQMHYQICENNPEFNGYQRFVPSEYSPLEFVRYGMNQHLDTNQQNVSSLYNERESYPPVENQNFHYPFRTSEHNKMELANHEIYSLFDTNKRTVTPENSQIEYCNTELNPQFNTNQIVMSSEYSHMEYCTSDMNPQINENQRAVTNKNHPFLGRIFSQQLTRISEVDLKPVENFKSNQQKLDSVDSCINGKTKSANLKPLQQIDTNISSINQNKLQSKKFQTNTFLLNSSFKKHFNVDSKEAQKECDNFRRSVSIKGNQIGFNSYHKNTFGYCFGEKQFRETLDSAPCNDIREESKTYDSCKNKFKQKSKILKQSLINNVENPYVSHMRKTTLSNKSNLIKHRLVHSKERSFKCDLCGKDFTRKSNLETHYHIHTEEKPFKCDLHEKEFRQECTLKALHRIHRREGKFKCDVCEEGFRIKHDLESHKVSHEGKKPYKCSVCEKEFSREVILKAHYRIHTGKK